MEAATFNLLVDGARLIDASLDARAIERLARYLALLTRWSRRINLTAAATPDEIVAKHFVDSLAIVPRLGDAQTLVDVGSGAGFPGAVVAVARPALRVTLVESVQKKAAFLEALRRELDLPLTVEARRLEELPAPRFDVAVSRAVFAPSVWLERGAPLVAPGGLLAAMLGRERPALSAPPGFTAPELVEYRLPGGEARALALLRRT